MGEVAGATLAKRFGWKVGDRIPIKNALYGTTKTWEFNLDGIYTSQKEGGDESQFWLQWKYFDENVPSVMKSTAGWYVIKLDSPDDSVRVAKTIDTQFANSSNETKTETESAFQAGFAKQLGNIEFLILAIDPHPRKPGAFFEPPAASADESHSFAALAALKKAQADNDG